MSGDGRCCWACGFDASARVVRGWSVFTPELIVSGNKHVVNVGKWRHAYQRERDKWRSIAMYWRVREKIPRATEQRRVVITRMYGGGSSTKRLDRDNLWTGCKALLDALHAEGILRDDRERWAEIYVRQEEAQPGKAGTLVTIEVLDTNTSEG